MSGSTFDLLMLVVSTAAQVAFVALWLTQRWWATSVGRVLLAKSAVLAVLFVASLWVYFFGPLPVWLGRLMFASLTVAIVAQLAVMAREVWRARREHRPVSGTNGKEQQRVARRRRPS